jgi:rhomboid protease GluP
MHTARELDGHPALGLEPLGLDAACRRESRGAAHRLLILVSALGFPVALVLGWIFDWTERAPERRTSETPVGRARVATTDRGLRTPANRYASPGPPTQGWRRRVSDGTMPPGDEALDLEFRLAETAAQANEWALVLFSAGIPSRVVRVPHGFALQVHRSNAERAEAELRAYLAENAEAAKAEKPPRVEVTGAVPINAALIASLAMLGFYGVTGPSRPDVIWFSEGSAHGTLIRAGELWRTVTALTLHADLTHLIGNVLLGAFFLAAVGRSLGPGVALSVVILAGAGGNLLNAFLRSTAHISIGASTAVFGAVGVLSGFGIVRRAQRGDRWRVVLVPFAAGLGLLAMIGSGDGRVDVFAHLFGLLVGVVVGLGAGIAMPRPPGAWAQLGFAAASVAALLGSWKLALC